MELATFTESTFQPLWEVGSTYTIVQGRFGAFPDVLKKTAKGEKKKEEAQIEAFMLQRLHKCFEVCDIYNTTVNADTIEIIVPKFQRNWLELLDLRRNGSAKVSISSTTDMFRQMYNGLQFIHQNGVVHCDLTLSNVYLEQKGDKLLVKISGFKKALNFRDAMKKHLYYQREDWDTDLNEAFGGADPMVFDKMSACKLMYAFFALQEVPLRPVDFATNWTDQRSLGYRKLHLRHLIDTIVNNPFLAIEDILFHPFFLSIDALVGFEDRFRTYSCVDRNIDIAVEKRCADVFHLDWSASLKNPMLKFIRSKTPSTKTFTGLWITRRNRRHHRDEDPWHIKQVIGPLPGDNFKYWENIFPAFFLHLFVTIAGYKRRGSRKPLHEEPEFKNFFPASEIFYKTCALTPVFRPM